MLTLTKEERNGSIVYNAKGDLNNPGDLTLNIVNVMASGLAEIVLEADGTITSSESGSGSGIGLPGTDTWVDIGTAQEIIDDGVWQGASNYIVTYGAAVITPGGGGFANESVASGGNLSSGCTFEFGSNPPNGLFSTCTWTVTITNNASGTQSPESVTFDLKIDMDDGNI